MKKLILISACIFFASGVGAQTTTMVNIKAEKRADKEVSADADEFQSYITAAKEEIMLNDKRIAALLSKLVDQKSDGGKKLPRIVQKLVKDVVVLQRYNEELRAELETYMTYGTGDWRLFKKEFNRDLGELSSGISDLRKRIYDDFIALR